jgi:hypothetical protein
MVASEAEGGGIAAHRSMRHRLSWISTERESPNSILAATAHGRRPFLGLSAEVCNAQIGCVVCRPRWQTSPHT